MTTLKSMRDRAADPTQDKGRLAAAFAAFDRANGEDPNQVLDNSRPVAKELLYARRMSAWLPKLYPAASEILQLATRSQHIERWVSPRDSYPEGRSGYLTWRRELQEHHARRAGEILGDLGYATETIDRVGSLLRKKRLKRDPEAQALEDVACVVFLVHYFADFARPHAEEKVLDILRKTWAKMSPHGRRFALALDLPQEAAALVARALAEPEQGQPSS